MKTPKIHKLYEFTIRLFKYFMAYLSGFIYKSQVDNTFIKILIITFLINYLRCFILKEKCFI